MNFLKTLRIIFNQAPAKELMQSELEEAERRLLEALSDRDHAEACVMYNQRRIARLRADLAEHVETKHEQPTGRLARRAAATAVAAQRAA